MQTKRIENRLNNLEKAQNSIYNELKNLQKELKDILNLVDSSQLKKSFIKRVEKSSADVKKGRGKEFKNIKELKRHLDNL